MRKPDGRLFAELIVMPSVAALGMTSLRGLLVVLLAVVVLVQGVPVLTAADRDVLRACGSLTDGDLSHLDKEEPVSRTLPTPDKREIAIAGAIRVGVPAEFFVRRLRDIVAFKHSPMVSQIGRFSDPPVLEDLASLRIDAADIREIRQCRVGDCAVKLPAGAIERFRTEIDWQAADADVQAERLSKQMLLQNVLGYLDGGDQTLGSYYDKPRPVSPAQEFATLIQNVDCASTALHEEFRYLTKFPRKKADGAESFVYWSKEGFGMKAVVSLTHVVIFQPKPEGLTLIASKGIYSSHYMDASLSLTWLLNVTTASGPGVEVFYTNRSRVDALGGLLGGVARGIATGRQRDGVVRELRRLKARLEADWRTAPDGISGQR